MMFYLYVVYYLFMNVLAFVIYAADKRRAVNRQRRVPEFVLLGLAVLGGAVGAFIAMRYYSHKIHYAIFCMGVPAMILLHGCVALYLIEKGKLMLPC